jgi:hypothetical protein
VDAERTSGDRAHDAVMAGIMAGNRARRAVFEAAAGFRFRAEGDGEQAERERRGEDEFQHGEFPP